MAAQRIDGKAVAEKLIAKVGEGVQARVAAGKRAPALAVILVGEAGVRGLRGQQEALLRESRHPFAGL